MRCSVILLALVASTAAVPLGARVVPPPTPGQSSGAISTGAIKDIVDIGNDIIQGIQGIKDASSQPPKRSFERAARPQPTPIKRPRGNTVLWSSKRAVHPQSSQVKRPREDFEDIVARHFEGHTVGHSTGRPVVREYEVLLARAGRAAQPSRFRGRPFRLPRREYTDELIARGVGYAPQRLPSGSYRKSSHSTVSSRDYDSDGLLVREIPLTELRPVPVRTYDIARP